jgi:hypothetical protein
MKKMLLASAAMIHSVGQNEENIGDNAWHVVSLRVAWNLPQSQK